MDGEQNLANARAKLIDAIRKAMPNTTAEDAEVFVGALSEFAELLVEVVRQIIHEEVRPGSLTSSINYTGKMYMTGPAPNAAWTCDCCGARYGPQQKRCDFCNPDAQRNARNVTWRERHICAEKGVETHSGGFAECAKCAASLNALNTDT